jgi:hypothetical protein
VEHVPEILPLRIVARQLRIPAKWLRDEAIAGRIPHINAAGKILAIPSVVERVLSERAMVTAPGRAVAHA